MANTVSARKRVRSSEKKRMINKQRLSRVRTYIKKAKEAVATGDYQKAKAAFVTTQSEIDRGARKGVLSKNKAARQVANLNQQVKNLM